MASWLANDPQNALSNLLNAYASMAEQVYGIVADQGSPDVPGSYTAGWSTLLDPTNCPAAFIPFGAQFVGVQIPLSTDTADARSLWKQEAGFARGTGFGGVYTTATNGLPPPFNGGAIVTAAQRYLTGTQSVTLLERTASPGPLAAYNMTLVVKPSELVSASQLTAAVDAVRPNGITWQLVQSNAYIWSAAIHTWSADTFSWAASASTQP